MPTTATPSPQRDLFVHDTPSYHTALARYDRLRPILGPIYAHPAKPSYRHSLSPTLAGSPALSACGPWGSPRSPHPAPCAWQGPDRSTRTSVWAAPDRPS